MTISTTLFLEDMTVSYYSTVISWKNIHLNKINRISNNSEFPPYKLIKT